MSTALRCTVLGSSCQRQPTGALMLNDGHQHEPKAAGRCRQRIRGDRYGAFANEQLRWGSGIDVAAHKASWR